MLLETMALMSAPTRPEEFKALRELLREYAQSLDVDLCFQGFEEELANLPGPCAPPLGRLLTVHVDGALAQSRFVKSR